jgi:FtsP/CotA-like multicopper oxidase with cupredoxin domain
MSTHAAHREEQESTAMKTKLTLATLAVLLGLSLMPQPGHAAIFTQCPGDANQDAVPDSPSPGVKCVHLSAGDGFVTMADGYLQYIFGFANMTGRPVSQVMEAGALAANFSAPTLEFDQDDEVYLNLSNVSMINRPDLADPHSVHYHGFPNAAAVFDGLPEASIIPLEGSTMTYYYKQYEPGTYIYHCHVEAAEHMQMGMLGNLYVRPRQNRLAAQTFPGGFAHTPGKKYVYNDGDGSTYYDVEFPLQLAGFDRNFHDASRNVQPLHFAVMTDTYPMINGRGYPDTKNPAALPAPLDEEGQPANGGKVSQPLSSLITATAGQKVLLRISSLGVTRFYTVGVLGLPMKVVGRGGRLLRGPGGKNLAYDTNSVTLGGGEAVDVIVDTAGVTPGRYFLYTTNLNYLSNNAEDFGGMMTEIVIN